MAYDEALAGRIRSVLSGRKGLSEKKMFGGLAFFLNGNMCAGVIGNEMVMKVPRELEGELLARKGCRPFDFTGRPMGGFVMVASLVLHDEDELVDWLDAAVSAAAALPPKPTKAPQPAKAPAFVKTRKPEKTSKSVKSSKPEVKRR